MRYVVAASVVVAVLLAGDQAFAQKPVTSRGQLGVDLVTLKDGTRLRGAILGKDGAGTTVVVVSRQWLRERSPQFLERLAADEVQTLREAYTVLRKRIDEWQTQRPKDERLQLLLRTERERTDEILAAMQKKTPQAEPQFLAISLRPGQISDYYAQPPARKQIVLLAWRERLDRPETRSVMDLARELREVGIDVRTEPVDLSDRLPVQSQNARQWAARRAIVEYEYRKRIDFQGTGEFLVRSDPAAKGANLMETVAGVLRAQLAGGLLDLLATPAEGNRNKRHKFDSATRAAEEDGALGVRVTFVKQDLEGGRVRVESRFLAHMPNGTWETIWSHEVARNVSAVRRDLVDRIAKDPQVRKAGDMIRSLGLSVNQDTFDLALRFGAATMDAQQAADGRFFEFRDRYLTHLDGPPILDILDKEPQE